MAFAETADAYVAQHGAELEVLLGDAVNALIDARAPRVPHFLADHFASIASAEQ